MPRVRYGQQLRKSRLRPVNTGQFGFCARHCMTLQCMRFTDHVTLIANSDMTTAAAFSDIRTAFDPKRHPGLLYKLRKLIFSTTCTLFLH
jgi:hypothetical protein